MRIDGDIRVWTDRHKACARLYADGPEGPIIIQASAPLGPIKRMVARMFARRGVSVSGDDAAYKSTVSHLARKKALRRLRRLAPRAFKRGGLGPYLASQELARRKRLRFALDRTGQPVGPKALGPAFGRKPRHRRSRARLFFRPNMPGVLPRPMLPAGAAAALALARLRPGSEGAGALTMAPARGGGAPSTSSAAEAEETQMSNPVEQADDPQAQPADAYEGEGDAPGEEATDDDEAQSAADNEAADDDDGDSDSDGDHDEPDGAPDQAGVSGDDLTTWPASMRRREALRRALARRQLQAALRFLQSARRNPHARRRLRQLATLAGEGDPKARKTIKVLALAHEMTRHGRAASGARPPGKTTSGKTTSGKTTRLPPAPAAAAPLPLLPVPSRHGAPAPSTGPTAKPPAELGRWWDILAAWRRGMG